jgi:hypothetical protein
MKIISFINEQAVIRKILEHLNLCEVKQRQRPPPSRAGPKLLAWKRQSLPGEPGQQELFDDDWTGFDEPYITYD